MNIEFKKLEWKDTTEKTENTNSVVSYSCTKEIKLRDFGFEDLPLWYSIFLFSDNHFYVGGNAMMIKYENGFLDIQFKTLEEAKEFVQEYHDNFCKEMINRILS